MTKQEMYKRFEKLMADRNKVLGSIDIDNALDLEDDIKRDIISNIVGNTADTVDLLVRYMLEKIQPFSEGSIVWWAYVLRHMSGKMEQVFDDRQKALYEHIGEMMTGVESSVVMIDMSQFPGGMKK